jgi:3-hydroxyacyl-[acyl-carrier-protein] dehydratase
MLLNNFYTIKSIGISENKQLEVRVEINSEHPILAGHFPGHPVVPGVCLTQMITDSLSQAKKTAFYLQTGDSIKFLNLVEPGQHTLLTVSIRILEEGEEGIRAEAIVFNESQTFLKFKGKFARLKTADSRNDVS